MNILAFEIGGGLGSAAIGFLVDRLFAGRSLWTLFVSIVLSSLSLLSFILTAHWGAAVNVTFLLLAGATNCGPDSLLSGSIPARLGERNGLGAGAALTGNLRNIINESCSSKTFCSRFGERSWKPRYCN